MAKSHTPESYEAKGRRTLMLRALVAPISAMRWSRYLHALHARVGAGAPPSRALSKPLRSYLRRDFWPHRRVSILMETWDWLEAKFSDAFLKRFCDGEDALILCIRARKNSEYNLYFSSAVNAAMQREGEMSIYCARAPQDEKLCRASFAVASVDGCKTLVIGGLQGPQGANKREVIDATREMWGLRPKDAVLLAIRAFAAETGIQGVHAVSDASHVLTRLTNTSKFSNYDEYWRERGARADEPFGFVFEPVVQGEADGSKRDAVKSAIFDAVKAFVLKGARRASDVS